MFGSPGWGWHIETAVHVLRLVLGGVSDRFPKLQLVIGHLGEGLMSLFPRLDNMTPAMTKLQRPITAYLRENVYYTVPGFNFPTTFLNLLLEVGARWRAHFWNSFRFPWPIANASRTVMRRNCSGYSRTMRALSGGGAAHLAMHRRREFSKTRHSQQQTRSQLCLLRFRPQ